MKKLLLAILLAVTFSAGAQITPVNVGSVPNDPAADNLRTAFQKVNTNFAALSDLPAGLVSTNPALQTALAANLVYVDPVNGNDTNAYPGPYETIASAQSNAVAGDTIVVKPGTYNVYVTNGFAENVNWYFEEGATVSHFEPLYCTNLSFKVSGRGTFTTLGVWGSTNLSWEFKQTHFLVLGNCGTTNATWKLAFDSLTTFSGLLYTVTQKPSTLEMDFKSVLTGGALYWPHANVKVVWRGVTAASWDGLNWLAQYGITARFEGCKILAPEGFLFEGIGVPVKLTLVNCDIRVGAGGFFVVLSGMGSTLNMSATNCRIDADLMVGDAGDSGAIALSGCIASSPISTSGAVIVTGSATVADWASLP